MCSKDKVSRDTAVVKWANITRADFAEYVSLWRVRMKEMLRAMRERKSDKTYVEGNVNG